LTEFASPARPEGAPAKPKKHREVREGIPRTARHKAAAPCGAKRFPENRGMTGIKETIGREGFRRKPDNCFA
jgi:hypothetical protein